MGERNDSIRKLNENINQLNNDIEDQALKHINEIGDKNARINAISTELQSVKNNLDAHEKLVRELNLKLTKSEDNVSMLKEEIAKKETDCAKELREKNSK